MITHRIVHGPLLATLVALAGALSVRAANIAWAGGTDTNFQNGANWSGGIAPSNNLFSDFAVFGTTVPNGVTSFQPSLTASRMVSGLVFQATSGGWILGGTSLTLTNGAGGIDDSANVSGTDTINANVSYRANQTWSVGVGGNLQINGTVKAITGNTTLTIAGGNVTIASLDADNVARQFNKAGSGTLAINGAAGVTLQATVALTGGGTVILGNKSALGTGKLTLNGTALQASTDLSGANAIANTWEIGGNHILFSGANNITMAGNYLGGAADRKLTNSLASGKTLVLSGAIGISSDVNNRMLILSGTGDTLVSGVVSNGGTSTASKLQIDNTGVTTLTGTNAFAGTATLGSGSTVVLGNQWALGTGTQAINGATIQASSDLSGANAISNAWGITGPVRFSGANNITYAGNFGGMNASCAITNDLASGKTLVLSGVIGISSDVNNRTLNLSGTGNTTISGVISNGGTSTASALVIKNTGLTTLSAANAYNGATTISNGTLALTGVGSLAGGLVSVISGAQLLVTNGTSTVGGVVTNAGLVSVAEATATFSQQVVVVSGGSYSFRGATNVFSGGLVVTSNGFLGGSGRVQSSVTVSNDGTLSPGNSPGTMTFSGNLTLLGSSFLTLEIGAGGTNAGAYDFLDVSGLFTKNGTVLVTNVGSYAFQAGNTFNFFDAGALSGVFSATLLPTLGSGLQWDTSVFESQGILSVLPIPEPSTLLAIGTGLFLLAFLRRRV
jgi:autotransporter-associated beta strand protein